MLKGQNLLLKVSSRKEMKIVMKSQRRVRSLEIRNQRKISNNSMKMLRLSMKKRSNKR